MTGLDQRYRSVTLLLFGVSDIKNWNKLFILEIVFLKRNTLPLAVDPKAQLSTEHVELNANDIPYFKFMVRVSFGFAMMPNFPIVRSETPGIIRLPDELFLVFGCHGNTYVDE